MNSKVEKKGGVLIAGGGTGGHIYPAIAVAQALKHIQPGVPVDFVGTARGLETKIVPRENFPLHFVKVGALNSVGPVTKILTLLSLPLAVLQGARLLFKLKPKAVLGVGGYASGPVMMAAILLNPILKMRLYLFESNAYPGLTNRWLSRFVQVSFVNFQASTKFFKNPVVVGMPVRSGLKSAAVTPVTAPPAAVHEKLRILVFGGSQGARGINITVSEAVEKGGSWLEGVEIVHQIGSHDFKKFNERYSQLKPGNVQWFEFLYDMPERYRWADVAFCRAGASTLAELAACKKASVLVPFPFASDNHQQENAQALVEKNAALMILQKDFTAEKFMDLVENFKQNPQSLKSYEKAVGEFFKDQSAEKIASVLAEAAKG